MADYYLVNPNIFECIFISKYEDGVPNELRDAHEQQAEFIQFVSMFLQRASSKTGVHVQTVKQIHNACLSLTVGTVLLHLKERLSHIKKFKGGGGKLWELKSADYLSLLLPFILIMAEIIWRKKKRDKS